ncbi:hypothetical protein XA68_13334 [Ophiocordyceps unilateralis]|uniref:Uncharacterized protein n=1 Tax=Ophiocordyceps unilateralis TaxID=268505 RepID=A0A2A9PCQ2_OPHUN|nr:hypothetical protein XA68_13334 [Ophiocordyceps unilateralis]
MPFVGDGRNEGFFHPDRKRRWDGAASEAAGMVFRLYSPERIVQDSASRRTLPLAKRARGVDNDNDEMTDDRRHRPCQQQKAATAPDSDPHQHHGSRPATPRSPTAETATAAAAVLLMPCNVCHRRPTKKSDLDSFAQCQGCRRQTCYVCIRECHGWLAVPPPPPPSGPEDVPSLPYPMDNEDDEDDYHDRNMPRHGQHPSLLPADEDEEEYEDDAEDDAGWHAWGHRAVVCSRCCVERGREGDVVCLGCLSAMTGT